MSGLQEVLNKYAKEGREGGTAKETLQQECPSFEDSLPNSHTPSNAQCLSQNSPMMHWGHSLGGGHRQQVPRMRRAGSEATLLSQTESHQILLLLLPFM